MKLQTFSDSEVGEYIEIPDWAELLLNPFFHFADIDFAYKNGTDFIKTLIDKTPFKGKSDRITVFFEVRVSSPNKLTTFIGNDNWHCDNLDNDVNSEGVNHLLTSKTSFMTEFINNEIIVPEDIRNSLPKMHKYVNELSKEGKIDPITMPHNRIVTFGDAFHRASLSKGTEFRLIYRAQELSNKSLDTHPTVNKIQNTVSIYDQNDNYIKNVEKRGPNKIDLFYF